MLMSLRARARIVPDVDREEEMQYLTPDQPTTTWGATFRRVSRDVGELAHDFGWLAGWVTVKVGAAAIQGRALIALKRRLGLPA